MKNVDVVIISWAKDDALLQVTKDGLHSLFKSEEDIAFHAYIVESNKDVKYEDLKEALNNNTIIRNLDRFVNIYDDENIKNNILNRIELLLYNNRNMVDK